MTTKDKRIFKRGQISVEVLAYSYMLVPDGTNPHSHRLITLKIEIPRYALPQFATHRIFSRSTASSRAVKVNRMIESVLRNPFIPARFPKTHIGMEASEWFEPGTPEYEEMKAVWLAARDNAAREALRLDALGVSKQYINRLLEPFLMLTMIVTASEWENFIALRAHHAAQEDIAILAELILQALNECEPQLLNGGEWHLPYGDRIDQTRLEETFAYLSELTAQNELIIPTSIEELRLMIIVARCARISYLNHENRDDYLADVALFSRLFREGHWSPFEHVARAIPKETYRLYYHATPEYIEYGWKANFRGWEQLRTLTPRNVENRPEPRLKPIQID